MGKIQTCRNNGIRDVAFCTMTAIVLLLAGGCATAKSVKYDPILSYQFKPRQVPARITRDNVKTLESKGYYELGNISAFYPTSAGEEKKAQVQLEEMLLKEAARQGGDVVRLDVENQSHVQKIAEKDKCISWATRRQSGYEYVPYQECYIKCVTKTRLELVSRDVRECSQWTYTDTLIPGRMSSGSVWRYDPQMKDMAELSASELPRAAKEGQIKTVKLLLKRGASVNAFDNEGYTALHRAVEANQIEVARFLLENRADVNALTGDKLKTTPLAMAVKDDQIEMVKLLLARGADVNKGDGPGEEEGTTPLMWAAYRSRPEVRLVIIKLLLDRGADINAAIISGTWKGMTSLMWASWYGTASEVKELIARGAKVDQTDKNGWRALHYAAYNKSPEVIKLLVAHGSNVNWQDVWGQSSLMIAALNANSVDNVKVLLALGADKNLKNEDGKTAMDKVKDYLEQSGTIYFEKEVKEIKKLLSQ